MMNDSSAGRSEDSLGQTKRPVTREFTRKRKVSLPAPSRVAKQPKSSAQKVQVPALKLDAPAWQILDHAMLDMDIIEKIRDSDAPFKLLQKAPFLREAYKAFLHVATLRWPHQPKPYARNPNSQDYTKALQQFSRTVSLYAEDRNADPASAKGWPLFPLMDVNVRSMCGGMS